MPLFDWKEIALKPDSSIKEALQVLDSKAMQIVLVVDHIERLVGTLTDGDIRRGLLRGESLESPVQRVVNEAPIVGYEEETEIVWKRHISRNSLRHLPVLNKHHQLVGLFYHKTSKTPERDNPVVLMLGGLGTRLRPLTETLPKPMLPVGNQPILETILKHIADQGFTEFYFCINYLGDKIRSYFGDGSDWGVQISYVEESEPLGTAGALSLLPGSAIQTDQPILVMNGDLLTKIDFRSLLDFHQSHDNSITTCVREYSHQVPYGVVELQESTISQLVEKPTYRYFVNAGIYCLSPQVIYAVPADQFYDMPELIKAQMAKGIKMGGFPLAEYWMDIGHIPDYEQAQADYEIFFK